MKILQIDTYDISGGAARAAYRLHRGLLQIGQDCRTLVRYKASTDDSVFCVVPENPPEKVDKCKDRWERCQSLNRKSERIPRSLLRGASIVVTVQPYVIKSSWLTAEAQRTQSKIVFFLLLSALSAESKIKINSALSAP